MNINDTRKKINEYMDNKHITLKGNKGSSYFVHANQGNKTYSITADNHGITFDVFNREYDRYEENEYIVFTPMFGIKVRQYLDSKIFPELTSEV